MADTKDWTWVLEQRCPECGFDAQALDRAQIGEATRAVARRFGELLDAGEGVRSRPSPEVWSALEYGCHVRDVFAVMEVRMARMLDEDDPMFPNWDQDATAVDERYDEQDPVRVRDELLANAAALADRYDRVADDAWSRPGRRSDGAAFTVESLGRYMVHDPVHHVWDVEQARATTEPGPRSV